METIPFEEFKKLDIRICKVLRAERIEGADKLLKLILDTGEGERQVLAGIAEYYSPEELVGRQVPVLLNLEPRRMKGEWSNGMILAAEADTPVLLCPDKEVPPGSIVR